MPRGRSKAKNGRRVSRKATDVERNPAYALYATEQIEQFDKPVAVSITQYRVRTCDTDGQCEKLLIDAIIDCGILKDDTAKHIKAVVKNAVVKVKNEDEEKTVIEIEEV